jgi:glyoxylase-like metal-dependent hydrolase (beta-lactamase superfamily II)
MQRSLTVWTMVAAALALCATPISAQYPIEYDFAEVTDGVYVATQTDPVATPVNGNSVVIIGETGVVVVDAGLTPGYATDLIGRIKQLTDLPVRYVVTTHWHDDHVFGNQGFRDAFPDVQFVTHDSTRIDFVDIAMPSVAQSLGAYEGYVARIDTVLASGMMPDSTPLTDEQRERLEGQKQMALALLPEMLEMEPVPATLTFERDLTLHLGDRTVELHYLGRGNTRGDIVVYLPESKVLATGDMVVNPVPFSLGSYLGDWIESLTKASEFEADYVITGHGPLQHDMEYVLAVRELLQEVMRQVKDAADRGFTLEETREAVDLSEYQTRFAGEDRMRNRFFEAYFETPAVERAYLEVTGQDLGAVPE